MHVDMEDAWCWRKEFMHVYTSTSTYCASTGILLASQEHVEKGSLYILLKLKHW